MTTDKQVNLCRISVQLTIVAWLLPFIISALGDAGVVAIHGFWYLVAPLFAIIFAIAGLMLQKPVGHDAYHAHLTIVSSVIFFILAFFLLQLSQIAGLG
jgi:hypothetical protein